MGFECLTTQLLMPSSVQYFMKLKCQEFSVSGGKIFKDFKFITYFSLSRKQLWNFRSFYVHIVYKKFVPTKIFMDQDPYYMIFGILQESSIPPLPLRENGGQEFTSLPPPILLILYSRIERGKFPYTFFKLTNLCSTLFLSDRHIFWHKTSI